jgi:hypothetical protein
LLREGLNHFKIEEIWISMSQTRAQTARLARIADINARHPEAIQWFTKGVESTLKQWTALELATFHQWGGPGSNERAEALVVEIVELFLGPDKIYKDDIALLLEDYLDVNFSTICEDGSPDELGEKFCTMWRECLSGNNESVVNMLSKEWMRHEMQILQKSEGLEGGDADDGSDDGEMNDAELELDAAVAGELSNGKLGGIEEGTMETEEPEPVQVKDPDGWETVATGKNKKSTRKK